MNSMNRNKNSLYALERIGNVIVNNIGGIKYSISEDDAYKDDFNLVKEDLELLRILKKSIKESICFCDPTRDSIEIKIKLVSINGHLDEETGEYTEGTPNPDLPKVKWWVIKE